MMENLYIGIEIGATKQQAALGTAAYSDKKPSRTPRADHREDPAAPRGPRRARLAVR